MTEKFENKINSAVRSVEPSAEFSQKLWNQIDASNRQIPASKGVPRWLWIPVSVALVLTITFIVVTPQQVMAAFRSLFSYIPGIGFVQEDENTLYLSEPVIIERDGATLTIDQVVADADKTTVSYHFDGLPTKGSGGASACFYDHNRLQLSNGATYLPIGGSVVNNTARVEFMPLPEGMTGATLLVSMDIADPLCTAPQEWDVDFSLGITPPDAEVFPVIENEGIQMSSDADVAENTDPSVQMVVDRAVSLEDGYLVTGHIEFQNENWESVFIESKNIHASDGVGNDVTIEPSDESNGENEFSFKIMGKDYIFPITFRVEKLIISASDNNDLTFSFDAGSDPQVGQNWDLNQTLEVFNQNILVKSITVIQQTVEGEEEPVDGYSITVNSENDINGIIACKGEGENDGIWGQTMPGNDGDVNFETFYSDKLPGGMVTCNFYGVQFEQEGSWQFTWQLPTENE